jgi:hypothetical protein
MSWGKKKDRMVLKKPSFFLTDPKVGVKIEKRTNHNK